jgi:hypothetical protein
MKALKTWIAAMIFIIRQRPRKEIFGNADLNKEYFPQYATCFSAYIDA